MMDFKNDVIERSKSIPVLVDFWAPWCGPCQFLGPVLEELVKEGEGKWQLVKVNTDEEQTISIKYGVRGIPDVKLFINGEPVNGFTGALPKHHIKKWLDENLPNPRKAEFEELEKKYLNKEIELEKIRTFATNNPDFMPAHLFLAKQLIFTDPSESFDIVNNFSASTIDYQVLDSIKNMNELFQLNPIESNSTHEKLIKAKSLIYTQQKIEKAITLLISIITVDKSYLNELPRRLVVSIFLILGNDHELTKKYRRNFNMALY